MMAYLITLGRVVVTVAVVAIAGVIGWQLWVYYMEAPWTRDGRVRADVVEVATDVAGLVSDVFVRDNQVVKKGEPLFQIDMKRFQYAIEQAQAAVESAQATLAQANRDLARNESLIQASISKEAVEKSRQASDVAKANVDAASANLDVAKLNLQRSTVVSQVNGYVTNFGLLPGRFVAAGVGVFALVDQDTFRVEAYLEETKLRQVRIGDRATVQMMGDRRQISGQVQSIAAGISDESRMVSGDLLARVNPTFNWVRLAQRVPVRIALDKVPEGLRLVSGRTATVTIGDPGFTFW